MSSKYLKERIDEVLKEYEETELKRYDLSELYHRTHVLDWNQKIHDQMMIIRGTVPPFMDYGRALAEKPTEMFDTLIIDPHMDEDLRLFIIDMKQKYEEKLDAGRVIMEKKNRIATEVKDVLKAIITDVVEYFGGPVFKNSKKKKELQKKKEKKCKEVKKKRGCNVVMISDLKGYGLTECRALVFKLVMDMFDVRCRVERGEFDKSRRPKKEEEQEGEGEEEEEDCEMTYCKILVFDKMFLVDLTKSGEITSKQDMMICYVSKCKGMEFNDTQKQTFPLSTLQYKSVETWEYECEKTIAQGSFSSVKLGKPKSKVLNEYLEKKPESAGKHTRIAVREINFKMKMFQKVKLRHLFRSHISQIQPLKHKNIVEYLGVHKDSKDSKKQLGYMYARYYEDSIDGKKFIDTICSETEFPNLKKKSDVENKKFIELIILLVKICEGMRYVHSMGLIFFALPLSKVLVEYDSDKKEVVEARLRICNLTLLRKKGQLDMLRNFNRKYCSPEVLEGMRVLSSNQDPYTWKLPFRERMDVYAVGKYMADISSRFDIVNGHGRYVKLMNHCLNDNPSCRPTTQHVIAELLMCLKYLKKVTAQSEMDFGF